MPPNRNAVRTLAGIALLAATASAQPQATPNANAPFHYLRGYAAIRQAKATPGLRPWIDTYNSAPLDENATAAVRAAGPGLKIVRAAARLTHCDWGVTADEGVDAGTSHRGVVRELTALLGLAFRLHLAEGRTQQAVDHLLTGIALSRHLTLDGSLASALIGYSREDGLARLLARSLGELPDADVARLPSQLAGLPEGATPRQAFLSQMRISNAHLKRVAASSATPAELVERLAALPMLAAKAKDLVTACGGTADGVTRAIDELAPKYAEWATQFDRKPNEFERTFDAETATLKERNAVFRLLTPSIPRIQREHAAVLVRRAMLRAAIALRGDGLTALRRFPDPHSGEPFSYLAGRLRSRLSVNGQPVELQVAAP